MRSFYRSSQVSCVEYDVSAQFSKFTLLPFHSPHSSTMYQQTSLLGHSTPLPQLFSDPNLIQVANHSVTFLISYFKHCSTYGLDDLSLSPDHVLVLRENLEPNSGSWSCQGRLHGPGTMIPPRPEAVKLAAEFPSH